MNPYEHALRRADLLTGPPTGYLGRWLENAERRAIAPVDVVEVAGMGVAGYGSHLESLPLLEEFEEIIDRRGKSFFLVPRGTIGADVRMAVLLTYVLNAGTDYGEAGRCPGVVNDFVERPYSVAEVQRIMDRQRANSWSYDRDVRFVDRNGGRLVTTPHGILMGLGGNWIQRLFSQRGGTTWGDIFMVNTSRVADPAGRLRNMIQSRPSGTVAGRLDLDRLLHHEERHSTQWAALGYGGMFRAYSWELLRELVFRTTNRLEQEAGLRDGGYR